MFNYVKQSCYLAILKYQKISATATTDTQPASLLSIIIINVKGHDMMWCQPTYNNSNPYLSIIEMSSRKGETACNVDAIMQ